MVNNDKQQPFLPGLDLPSVEEVDKLRKRIARLEKRCLNLEADLVLLRFQVRLEHGQRR